MSVQHLDKMKKLIRQLANPRILTLDEALRKNLPNFTDETRRNEATSKTILSVIDRIATRFSTEEEFDRLNEGEKLIYELFFFSGEVMNSGLNAFLNEIPAETVDRIETHLKRIGAENCTAILGEVIQKFYSQNADFLQPGVEANGRSNPFERQDYEFREQASHLDQLLIKFVNDNKREFLEPYDNVVKELRKSELIRKHYGLKNTVGQDYVDQSLQAIDRHIDALEKEFSGN